MANPGTKYLNVCNCTGINEVNLNIFVVNAANRLTILNWLIVIIVLGVVRPFAKLLGIGVVTSVDLIELGTDSHSKTSYYIFLNNYLNEKEIEEISRKDGFDRVEDFFEWFKRYDLRTPKEFYLYKWKWLVEK